MTGINDYYDDDDGDGATGDDNDVDVDGAMGYDNNDGNGAMDDDCVGATDDDVRRYGRSCQR